MNTNRLDARKEIENLSKETGLTFTEMIEKLENYQPTEAKWLSEADTCDICGANLHTEKFFVDGRTKQGPWALMCPACHRKYGVGLGTGFGQKYDSKTKIKIAG